MTCPDADTDVLLLQIDAAMEAYSASIDRVMALASEMRQLADAVDGGMADARAEFGEWWRRHHPPQPAGAWRQHIYPIPSNPMTKSRTLHPTAAAARIAPLLLALAGLAIAAGGIWIWRHRQQIAAALVAAVATTYSAGAWGRQQIEALAADSARRLPSQPVAAVAPITATLAAAWGLVDRATTTRAKRAQWALLTDIASAYGLEVDDLLRPIKFRYSAAAAGA
jgi:hypothetical protein